jgi:hypothetical protein
LTDDERNDLIESALSFTALTAVAEDGGKGAQVLLEFTDHDVDKIDWTVEALKETAASIWAPGDITPDHLRWELALRMCRNPPPGYQAAARAFLDYVATRMS